MVTAIYDRTARRHTADDNLGNDPVLAEGDVLPTVQSDFAACRLQRVRVMPFALGESEPRVELGMGQLLDPSRNRSIIATGTFCAEYCAIHPDWAWEAL
jgi:hypothetical protein